MTNLPVRHYMVAQLHVPLCPAITSNSTNTSIIATATTSKHECVTMCGCVECHASSIPYTFQIFKINMMRHCSIHSMLSCRHLHHLPGCKSLAPGGALSTTRNRKMPLKSQHHRNAACGIASSERRGNFSAGQLPEFFSLRHDKMQES